MILKSFYLWNKNKIKIFHRPLTECGIEQTHTNWQLLARQQTDLLLLPLLTGTWLGFSTSTITETRYLILTKLSLVVSRSRTVSPPHGDMVVSWVSILASPNLDILSVKFHMKFIFEDHVSGIVYNVSQRIGILRLTKRIFTDTSVLLLCYFEFVLLILEYRFPMWGLAAECHLQLLVRLEYSVAWLCPFPIWVSCCVIDSVWLGLVCLWFFF